MSAERTTSLSLTTRNPSMLQLKYLQLVYATFHTVQLYTADATCQVGVHCYSLPLTS